MAEDTGGRGAKARPHYELIEHTADVGVRVYGETLTQLFAHAGEAMTAVLLHNPQAVEPREQKVVEATATDRGDLLVAWLNELIYLVDTAYFIGSVFDVVELTEFHLRADVTGEAFDSARHHFGVGIKAATYHDLEVKPADGGWVAQVVFDT
jgi:SHS2 domain-containing protein